MLLFQQLTFRPQVMTWGVLPFEPGGGSSAGFPVKERARGAPGNGGGMAEGDEATALFVAAATSLKDFPLMEARSTCPSLRIVDLG